MCGINGIISKVEDATLKTWVEGMHHQQKHRGKDDTGVLFFNNLQFSVNREEIVFVPDVAFAHQRLSVQDLSIAGHQPMLDDTKRYSIVFNGEVYNFQEVRSELEKEKVFFFSKTDTEVVLRAYIHWGTSCLHKFEGMFAFSIWDAKEQELFIARDRFGVKPFYYINKPDYFSFSSEIKGFKDLPFFTKTINTNAVHDYFINAEAERNGLCFFEEVEELLPGHFAFFDKKTFGLKIEKWYQLVKGSETQKDLGIVSQKVKDLVHESISRRLISDVPVGACLSGGLDSSIIVASMLQQKKKPFAFTATFDGFERDESKYAREFEEEVNWLKTSPSVIDFKNDIEKVIWAQDIPFFSASTFIQYKVMQLVGESGIKVTLDGQGADELFGGYAKHYALLFNSYFNASQIKKAMDLRRGANPLFCSKNQITKEFLKQFINKPNKYKGLFTKDLLAGKVKIENESYSSLNGYLREGVLGTTLKNLLRTGDRNSMIHTVEARMPFADSHELTEYALTIDPALKIKNGVGKYILREAFRGSVPESILNRKDKIGFEAPQVQWFRELKSFVRSVFPIVDDEFVNWSKIDQEFDEFYDHQISMGRLELWRLFNFQLWRKQWGV